MGSMLSDFLKFCTISDKNYVRHSVSPKRVSIKVGSWFRWQLFKLRRTRSAQGQNGNDWSRLEGPARNDYYAPKGWTLQSFRRQRRKLAPAPAALRPCCRPSRPMELRSSQKNSRKVLLAAIARGVLGLTCSLLWRPVSDEPWGPLLPRSGRLRWVGEKQRQKLGGL